MLWQELEQRDAMVNGVRIRYRIGGEGYPLVLLHGSPQTSLSWRKLIPLLPADRMVVAPDLRGYGDSDRPESGYELQTMVEDVRQLLQELGIRSVDMVGHDLGGIVAYVFATKHREIVRRLGIMEAPILGTPSPTLAPVLASYWHIGLYAHPHLPELLIAGRERAYLKEFFRTYAYLDAIEDSALADYARHLASPGGIRGMVGVYRAIPGELAALALLTQTKLTIPVWAVGGDRSMGLGPLEQFRQLADDVQGGVIKDCGHWVPEEQPVRIAEQLVRFLG